MKTIEKIERTIRIMCSTAEDLTQDDMDAYEQHIDREHTKGVAVTRTSMYLSAVRSFRRLVLEAASLKPYKETITPTERLERMDGK